LAICCVSVGVVGSRWPLARPEIQRLGGGFGVGFEAFGLWLRVGRGVKKEVLELRVFRAVDPHQHLADLRQVELEAAAGQHAPGFVSRVQGEVSLGHAAQPVQRHPQLEGQIEQKLDLPV